MKFVVAVLTSLLLSSVALANNARIEVNPSPSALATNVTVTGTQTDGATGDCSFVEITVVADIEGTNDLGGGEDQVRFSIFDDGAERAFEIVSVPVGTTETVTVTLTFQGVIGQGAPGVAVIINDGPAASDPALYLEDPYNPDVVAGTCPGEIEFRSVPVNSPLAIGFLALVLGLIAAGAIRSRA
jgi:hypothetical protein